MKLKRSNMAIPVESSISLPVEFNPSPIFVFNFVLSIKSGPLTEQRYQCYREWFDSVLNRVWTWSMFSISLEIHKAFPLIYCQCLIPKCTLVILFVNTLLITFPWFSCWPSRSPLALTYCFNYFIPKFMISVRNNHVYRFSSQRPFLADELCSSYLILRTVAPVALYSVCHFMSPLSVVFLLFRLMHILHWPLRLKFSLTEG